MLNLKMLSSLVGGLDATTLDPLINGKIGDYIRAKEQETGYPVVIMTRFTLPGNTVETHVFLQKINEEGRAELAAYERLDIAALLLNQLNTSENG